MANITGTNAGEPIRGTTGDDVIYGLGGDDVIDGDEGSDILYGGEGNDELREVSSGTQIQHHQMFGEAGDDVLALDLRSSYADTVLLDGGIGNDRITFEAWYTLQTLTIRGGDGDDSIRIVGGKTLSVDAGSGADRIELSYSDSSTSYSFGLGAGADILELNRVSTLTSIGAPIRITDFQVGAAGDRIILDRVLVALLGWDRITNPFASGDLALVQRGADAVVQIDLGSGDGLRDFFVLEGVTATALTDRNLGIAPNGGIVSPIAADGGAGADFLDGSGGADLLRGFEGADRLFGGLGNDRLEGGLGTDSLDGGFGDDVLLGEQGNDALVDYDAGNDQLLGGEGNDSVEVLRSYREPAGTIVLDGGAGDDTLRFGTLPYIQRRAKIDHVTLIGGDGNDNIRVSGAGVADVDAGAGADQVNVGIDGTTNLISLGSGADTLTLGAEATREIVAVVVRDFEAGNGGDRLDLQSYLQYALTGWNPLNNPFEYGYLRTVQRGADAVLQIDVDGAAGAGAMTDLVIFRNLAAASLTTFNLGGYASFTGTEGNDLIDGDSGNNTLRGLGGNDTLNGYDGDDLLDGGAGNDVMTGGNGSDVYIVTDAGDQVIEVSDSAWTSVDEVRTSLSVYAMPTHVERLVGTSSAGQTLTSQGGVIIGGGGNDIIDVGNGSGTANGESGDDLMKGGTRNDLLTGGAGSDILYGFAGNDSLYAGGGASAASSNDYLDGGDGNDYLRGSLGNDILIGGIGDDDLADDQSGDDLLDAGDGNDHLLLTRYGYGPVTVGTVELRGGAGNDVIELVVDNASIVTIDSGSGNDELGIYRFGGVGTVTLGAGADVIRFSDYMPSVDPNGRITVTDFDLGPGGDTLSWDGFLKGWLLGWDQTVNPFLSGHIRLGRSGTSTVLQLDRDGGGDSFATLLTFANTNPAAFTAAHLEYAPLGPVTVVGGSANDLLEGSAANDSLDGGAGDDIVEGRGGADILNGGEGSDTLFSANRYGAFGYPQSIYYLNNPTLDTGFEADTLNGGGGDDYIFAGFNDTVDGGAGSYDVVYLSLLGATSGVTMDFRQAVVTNGAGTLRGIEGVGWLQGSNYADDFTGVGGTGYVPAAVVYAMGGNDRVVAGYYLESLFGGDGDDFLDGRPSQYLRRIDGGADNDIIYTNVSSFTAAYGGAGNDTIYSHGETYGGSGNDLIILSETYYRGGVYGEEGDDEIRASVIGNQISGGAGADRLLGGNGADTLVSGDFVTGSYAASDDLGLQKDVLTGGGGDDFLAIGWGDDADGGSGADTLQLSFGGASAGLVFNATQVVGAGPLNLGGGTIRNIERISQVRGSDHADTLNLAAAGGAVTANGGGGDDSILGTSGNDTLRGDDGNDSLDGGDGFDQIEGGAGDDVANGGIGADILHGDAGQDWLIGGGGGDTITGGDGYDTLWGEDGDDVLDGGAGDDVIVGGAGTDTVTYGAAASGVEVDLSYLEDQLTRGAGADTLISIENVIGSNFADVLAGDAGANRLTGGSGNDRFVFNGLGARDTITDFHKGDLIDLSAIDANGTRAGEGAFAFIGAAAFGGVAGQLRVTGNGFTWIVEADTNGDGAADLSIAVSTLSTGMWFAGSDFLL